MTGTAGSPDRHPPARPHFECRARVHVDALDTELSQFVHIPTGARHLHLDLPTEDSAFLMAFPTPAPDSTGLTHVLEHLVMCGSERYPCRRAFFAMLGRTLGTAMNALTTEDCTAYHFATRSLADYENLLSVYLDAAFFPRLDRLDFEQEGCRVEIEAVGEPGERLVRRGVVLSEMRGLMNQPEQQLQQAVNRCLFPSTPYRFNAGGDPWKIPFLDYEALKAYHRRHYHPGNAVFLSAGSPGTEWLHTRLHELVLDRFPREEPSPTPSLPSFETRPLDVSSRCVVRYPVLNAQGRGSVGASLALAWRLGDTSDPMALARAQLLGHCLLEQGDAPLRRALVEVPAHPATLSSSGVQATRRRLVFQCGVHGCDPDRAGEIESRVLAVIEDVARDGMDERQVEGALAQMERALREHHDPRYPLPLEHLTRMLPAALYGGEPAAALDISRVLATLRAESRSRKGVAELVRGCLRDNPARVRVTAIPDPAAARRLDADDRARLEREYGPSRRQARERVMERSEALRRRQESRSGESSLPRLDLDSIGPPRGRPQLCALPAGGSPAQARHGLDTGLETGQYTAVEVGPRIWVSSGPTGGLVYAHLAIDILDVSDFDPARLGDIGLLREILPESGHGGFGPDETRARLARICDHLEVEPRILARAAPGSDASGAWAPRVVLLMSARAQAADEAALVEVLADAHLDVRFDASAQTAAAKARVRRCRELARIGHLHAERVAAARLDPWAAVEERWHGPGAIEILSEAADEGGVTGEPLPQRLHRVHRSLAGAPFQLQLVRDGNGLAGGGPNEAPPGSVSWPSAPATYAAAPGSRTSGGPQWREVGTSPLQAMARRASTIGAWIVDGPVSYCARVFPAVAASHPDAGPLAVLAAGLGGDLLQRAVRERGGAYGAGARYCERTCTVRMFSYRDPRLAQTLRDFDRAVETLHRHPPAGRRLEEAILRAVREIDKPRAFQVAAFERYLDELQGRGSQGSEPLRAAVLRTRPEQLRDAAERYLAPAQGSTGVLAGAGREAELDRLGIPWRRL